MNRRRNVLSCILFAVAAILFGFVLVFDRTRLDFEWLAEDTHPQWTGPFILRMVMLMLSAALGFIAVAIQRRDTPLPAPAAPRFIMPMSWGAVGLALATLALYLADVEEYWQIAKEDRLIEWSSLALLFTASGVTAWLAAHLVLRGPKSIRVLALFTGLLAALFFVVGGEEVSWFQRQLEISTPDIIKDNSPRNEINAHNFYTVQFEVAYYTGAFVFLVFLPFVHDRTRWLDWLGSLRGLIPTRRVALIAAPAFACNYVFWNLTFVQVPFWFSLFVVGHMIIEDRKRTPRERSMVALGITVFLTCALGQLFYFLGGGDRLDDAVIWASTEYKELLIPAAFAVYAFITFRNLLVTHEIRTKPSMSESALPIIAALFVLITLNYGANGVMTFAEFDSMVHARQFADPGYIPSELQFDLSSSPRTPSHLLYYPFMKALPMVPATIAIRLLGYLVMSIGLGLIARRIGLNAVTACVAIGLYLYLGQSYLPTSDAPMKRAESQALGYGLTFLGVWAVLGRRLTLAGVFAGLAMTFHLLIGGWGTMAMGLTVLFSRMGTGGQRIRGLIAWLIAGSAGLFFAVRTLLQRVPEDMAHDPNWIYVFFRNTNNLIPPLWQWDEHVGPIVMAAVLLGVLCATRRLHRERTESTLLARLSLWSLLPFVMGLLIYFLPESIAGKYLQLYPFRVGSTFLMLFGIMLATGPVLRAVTRRTARPIVAFVLAAFFFNNAIGHFTHGTDRLDHYELGAYRHDRNDTIERYNLGDWFLRNTDPGSIMLCSPRHSSLEYLCERPVVVVFKNIPSSPADIVDWYQRLIDLNGGARPRRRAYAASSEIDRKFNRLKPTQYQSIGRKYGAKYLVLKENHRDLPGLREVYRNTKWVVYEL